MDKYVIEYSNDWLLRQNDGPVFLYAPLDGQNDKEYENLGINVNPASGMTVEQCYSKYVKDLPSAFKDFQLIDEGNWNLNGAKAKWLECKFRDGSKSITNIICLVVNSDKLFVLVGYSSTAKYPVYKDSFATMIKSFKLE